MASKKIPIGFISRAHHLHEEYQSLVVALDYLGTPEGRVRIDVPRRVTWPLDRPPTSTGVSVPIKELAALLKREQKRVADELAHLNIDMTEWDPEV